MNQTLEKIELTEFDFHWFRQFIERETGIRVRENRITFMYNRLSRRLKELGIESFSMYRELLTTRRGRKSELENLLNEVVTPETSFFRYQLHFETLRSVIIPDLVSRKLERGWPVNIISMGCASGEEPYSIAMLLSDQLLFTHRHLVRIIGADLSIELVKKARAGFYHSGDGKKPPPEYLEHYFMKEPGGYRVIPSVARMVRFMPFNMVSGNWGKFSSSDIIFCRNVSIYFGERTRRQLVSKMVECTRPGGYLIFGHTEIIEVGDYRLKRIDNAVYRKEPV